MNVVLALALATSTYSSPSASAFDHSHSLWTEVLAGRVRGEGVEYEKLKADRAKLDDYLASLETVMPEEFAAWKREQRYAFWINAYNAYTIRRVVDAYPLASVKDLDDDDGKSFWDQEFVPLGRLFAEAADRKLTLNEIENEILRPKFKDARVHAALNCASRGCPPLFDEAFVADRLEAQLDSRVAKWLAGRAGVLYDQAGKRLRVSKIFEWYHDDFVRDGSSVQRWIGSRAPVTERSWIAEAEDLKIEYLDYSWKLNDARRD